MRSKELVRWVHLAAVALLAGGAACGSSPKTAVVVMRIVAAPGMVPASQLRVRLGANDERVVAAAVPPPNGDVVTIGFEGVTTQGANAAREVAVQALDTTGCIVAAAEGVPVTVAPGEVVNVEILLGVTDLSACPPVDPADASTPDAPVVVEEPGDAALDTAPDAGEAGAQVKPNGASCAYDDDCSSRACVEGICCASSCEGDCMGCAQATTGLADGTCGARKKGEKPRQGDCGKAPQSTCDHDGSCDGAGACSLWDTNTKCAVATCTTNNQVLRAAYCDGAGTCPQQQVAPGEACLAEGQACDPSASLCSSSTSCDSVSKVCSNTCAGCRIAGACLAAGAVNPANGCEICDPARTAAGWSARDGVACDDGLYCTANDSCAAGRCVGVARSCDDAKPCTADTCEERAATYQCLHKVAAGCLINGACVAEGAADPSNGCRRCAAAVSTTAFSNNDGATCSDGKHCTTNDKCGGGTCSGSLVVCSDSFSCTQDVCVEGSTGHQCAHNPQGGCFIAGACYPEGAKDPQNACKACKPAVSQTAFSAADGSACDDGVACTTGDTCSAGTCAGTIMAGYQVCPDGTCSQSCSPPPFVLADGTSSNSPCVLFNDGKIKCWGYNSTGRLGNGCGGDKGDEPGEMGAALPYVDLPAKVVQVSTGNSSSCAVLDTGDVYCWGDNSYGQIGLNEARPISCEGQLPKRVHLRGAKATFVSVGSAHACALLEGGKVRCWGDNRAGQLGAGDNANRGDAPGEMEALLDLPLPGTVTKLFSGASSVCAISTQNQLWCWGENRFGQLGIGNANNVGDGPSEIANIAETLLGESSSNIVQVVPGSSSCALFKDGRAKCWGWNAFGQLALGDTADRGDGPGEMGTALPFISVPGTLVQIVGDGSSWCALGATGEVRCWGGNSSGELGAGDTATRGATSASIGMNLPVVALGSGKTALRLGRPGSTCAILNDLSLKCWGANYFGQLGLGDKNNRGDAPGEMGDSLPSLSLK